jgi:IPT/TIG domain
VPIIKNVQNASASRDRSGAWRWQGGNIWRNPQTCRCGVQKSNASTYPERVACESRRERPAQERESGARLSNPSQVDSSRIRLFTRFQMRAGSIVILTAALLLAPVVPLASPAAAASQPVVSSVSPGSGTIGTPVTITGSGFNYGCTDGQTGQVYFGGQAAANATVTDGAATAVAPTHEAGAVYVQVADCLGDESGTRRADRYTYLPPGPSFFGLHVYETESREATIIAQLPKPGVLALRVMRVVSDGRLVFAGLVSFGQQPRGRSLIHWNFRINHHLLGPGRYELTLHGRRAGLLSAPAAPGARTLLILKDHRVRLPR